VRTPNFTRTPERSAGATILGSVDVSVYRQVPGIDRDLVLLVRSQIWNKQAAVAIRKAHGAVFIEYLDPRAPGVDHRERVVNTVCEEYAVAHGDHRTLDLGSRAGAFAVLARADLDARIIGAISHGGRAVRRAAFAIMHAPAEAAGLRSKRLGGVECRPRAIAVACHAGRRHGSITQWNRKPDHDSAIPAVAEILKGGGKGSDVVSKAARPGGGQDIRNTAGCIVEMDVACAQRREIERQRQGNGNAVECLGRSGAQPRRRSLPGAEERNRGRGKRKSRQHGLRVGTMPVCNRAVADARSS